MHQPFPLPDGWHVVRRRFLRSGLVWWLCLDEYGQRVSRSRHDSRCWRQVCWDFYIGWAR